MAGRAPPPSSRPAPGDVEAWHAAAREVVLGILEQEHAVTLTEIEARASDRTWNPTVWPWPINPHHLTTARQELFLEGVVAPTSSGTRSHPTPITTWSLAATAGRTRRIADAAARKRLLTARHAGWARRGGAGRGLIGAAGESAALEAFRNPQSQVNQVESSVRSLLGVPLLGEVDLAGYYVDVVTDPTQPAVVTIMVEVKNTRGWYYPDDPDLLGFLAKASHLQQERPDALILPVFLCRRFQYTLWELGSRHGFLPGQVENQLVLSDNELDQASLAEVSFGLGFEDLRLGGRPTNRHLGLVNTAIPRRAREYAELWRDSYEEYLVDPTVLGPDTTDI